MRVFKCILICIYVVFVICLTFLLLTFNKFSNSVIGNTIIAGIDYKIGNYNNGDLLIINKSKVNVNDDILFYDTKNGKNYINIENVKSIKKGNDITYVIRDNEFLSNQYVIGTTETTFAIPFLGYLYLFFTSRIGYFIFVIIPIIVYFVLALKRYKKS